METTITVFPQDTTQIKVLSTIMKALKIKFAIAKKDEKPYDPAFVAKILQSQKEYKEGKGIIVKPEDFKNFLGLE